MAIYVVYLAKIWRDYQSYLPLTVLLSKLGLELLGTPLVDPQRQKLPKP